MRRERSQAQRDAATVEMVFAAVTGAALAAVGFLAVAGPALAGAAHGPAREGWFTGAVIVAAAVFCGRVAITLRRFEQQRGRWDASSAAPQAPDGGRTTKGFSDALADPAAEAWRIPRQRTGPGTAGTDGRDGPPDQPSQPGRTSPDS